MSGVKRDVANDESAARKQDEMYLIILKNYMLKAEKESSGSFSLGRKILDYIEAELKNQVIGMQLATEIELYPENSFITRYWNIKLRLYHKIRNLTKKIWKPYQKIWKSLLLGEASQLFCKFYVRSYIRTFISFRMYYRNPPPLPRIFFFIRAVESWVLVGLEVDDETSPVVPCRMTGIRP
jgi:hypothetical protein